MKKKAATSISTPAGATPSSTSPWALSLCHSLSPRYVWSRCGGIRRELSHAPNNAGSESQLDERHETQVVGMTGMCVGYLHGSSAAAYMERATMDYRMRKPMLRG
jgi:hypothetical protein